MEVLNTISHTRVSAEPMLVPEKMLPLAKIKVAFICSLAFPFQLKLHRSNQVILSKNASLDKMAFSLFLYKYSGGYLGNLKDKFLRAGKD